MRARVSLLASCVLAAGASPGNPPSGADTTAGTGPRAHYFHSEHNDYGGLYEAKRRKRHQRTERIDVREHAHGQSKQARQSSGGVPSTCRTRNETGSLGRRTLAGSGGDREARAATLEAMVAWRRSSAGSGDDVSGEREPPTAKNPSES